MNIRTKLCISSICFSLWACSGQPSEADVDSDGDGIFDQKELALGTDPHDADSDDDGDGDGHEVEAHTDPLSAASQGDDHGESHEAVSDGSVAQDDAPSEEATEGDATGDHGEATEEHEEATEEHEATEGHEEATEEHEEATEEHEEATEEHEEATEEHEEATEAVDHEALGHVATDESESNHVEPESDAGAHAP